MDKDPRYEAVCVNCGHRIVQTTFLGKPRWIHQPAGAAFQDGQYLYCQLKAAEPPPYGGD